MFATQALESQLVTLISHEKMFIIESAYQRVNFFYSVWPKSDN